MKARPSCPQGPGPLAKAASCSQPSRPVTLERCWEVGLPVTPFHPLPSALKIENVPPDSSEGGGCQLALHAVA